MKINCAHDVQVELHKLQPNPKNPNKHPEKQIKMLAKIIDYQGQRSPIVVSKRSGFITKGHGRLEAIRSLGWEKAAVDYQEYESEAQEYADIIADNKIAELAQHDDLMMIQELRENDVLKDLAEDTELLGLPDFTLPPEVDPAKEVIEDNVPTNVETRAKTGDLWQLGKHKLFVGDATNIEHVQKLMGQDQAAMILTDPPYNVNYEGKTKDALKIENDKMGNESFYEFLTDTFVNYYTVALEGAPIYVFHADSEGANFRNAMMEGGFKLAQCLVWVKNSMVMGRQDYHWQHEPILYGWREGKAHTWMSDRKQTTVWNFDRPTKNTEHPTMKPINLLEYPINNSSAVGSIVVDFFGGSGSTLIACEKTGRVCRTMELDPKYADVILKRYEDYSGQKATLINS